MADENRPEPIGIRFLNSIINSLMAGSDKRSKKKMFDRIKEQKEFRDAYLGTNTPSKTKIKKLVRKNIVGEKPPVFKDNKKMKDKLADFKNAKTEKEYRDAYLGRNKNKPEVKISTAKTKAKTGPDKTKAKTGPDKLKFNNPDDFVKDIVNKNPARTVAEAQRRGLSTFTNKAGKKLAAVTKEQLDKSGLSLRDYLNKQKGLTRKKPTTKKKAGKKVFRRGGGKALRGFGKATYSDKLY